MLAISYISKQINIFGIIWFIDITCMHRESWVFEIQPCFGGMTLGEKKKKKILMNPII